MEGEKYLFVVSGPSGVGKDTVMARLRADHPEIEKTVSATTRAPREGEAEGVNYFYRTEDEFRRMLERDEIVESNYYSGHYYGTLRSEVDRLLAQNTPVVLNIDIHGAANIKRLYPGATTIFLLPPSWEVLESRLRGRGSNETAEEIQKRLDTAREELSHAGEFDGQVVNHVVEDCAAELYGIMARRAGLAEEH